MKSFKRTLLEQITDLGLSVTRSKVDGVIRYEIPGFYKSGTVNLIFNKDECIAEARYQEKTHIRNLDDLIHLNYEWWDRSKDRYEGWKEPHSAFAAHFIRLGLAQAKTESVWE